MIRGAKKIRPPVNLADGYPKNSVIIHCPKVLTAARAIKAELEAMKDIEICDNIVTIRSSVKPETVEALKSLADKICE